MSYTQNESYIEDAVNKCVKKLRIELQEFYLNGANWTDGELSDLISYKTFEEMVLDDLNPPKTNFKAMEALDEQL